MGWLEKSDIKITSVKVEAEVEAELGNMAVMVLVTSRADVIKNETNKR